MATSRALESRPFRKRKAAQAYLTHAVRLLIALALFVGVSCAHLDPLRHADSLNQEVLSLDYQGRYREAIPMARQVLAIYEQALGPTHPDVATSLNNLAQVLQGAGDFAAAKSIFERALKIREDTFGPTHPAVATSLNNLALLLMETGEYAAARPLLERALRIKEQVFGPGHPNVALGLNNLAELLRLSGEHTVAKALYERALQINERVLGPNHPNVAITLNNLGLLLETTGDYTAARPILERSLTIQRQVLGPGHPSIATTLNNLGLVLEATGDYAAARSLFQDALRIGEQALGTNHPHLAVTLNNLALLLRLTGDPAGARSLYERALNIRERAFGSTHPHVAESLNNLGALFSASGDYAAAKPLLEGALRIREQTLGLTHPDVAATVNNLAYLLGATGDPAGARRLYERALRLTEGSLGPNHPKTAVVLENLAMAEWQAGRPQDALSKLARAVHIARKHTAQGLIGLSNRQKLAFLKTTALSTDGLLSLPSGLVPNADAYRAVLDRKNLLFRTVAAERGLTEASPGPQVTALLEDYIAVRRHIAAATVSVPGPSNPPEYRERLAGLTQRLEMLEGSLSRASAAFRHAQAEATAGPLEVCATLPVGAGLIDLFWYVKYAPPTAPSAPPTWTPNYLAFVLRGGGCADPIRVDLGPAAPIDEDVRRFHDSISRDSVNSAARELRARYRKTLASRLYAKLFPPALGQAIEGKPRLIISPDGALALLPFGLLAGEEGHEFLLETRTISYLPSGRDLLRMPASRPTAPGLLAIGAPAFDSVPVQTAQAATMRAGCGAQDEPFVPLPGTAAELQAISRVNQQVQPARPLTLLEGPQATKAAILEQAPKASVLHLATHAYFTGEECTPAGFLRAPQGFATDTPAFLGHNPLLLAGIALAGANERDKADGILTALEVTALDLGGTDLVVLSACDTGLGTAARGQELLGLRWAFSYAGARNLVTSLWSVPDAETATLMTHFYTALWLKSLSVPEALRLAQLEMLRTARPRGDSAPHTWGAFVASGVGE